MHCPPPPLGFGRWLLGASTHRSSLQRRPRPCAHLPRMLKSRGQKKTPPFKAAHRWWFARRRCFQLCGYHPPLLSVEVGVKVVAGVLRMCCGCGVGGAAPGAQRARRGAWRSYLSCEHRPLLPVLLRSPPLPKCPSVDAVALHPPPLLLWRPPPFHPRADAAADAECSHGRKEEASHPLNQPLSRSSRSV